MGFSSSGDLILLGAVDRVTREVTGFEQLIGSHGGLGRRRAVHDVPGGVETA
jgi:hypothetical protein